MQQVGADVVLIATGDVRTAELWGYTARGGKHLLEAHDVGLRRADLSELKGGEPAGDVRAALTPVQARAAEHPLAGRGFGAEVAQEAVALVGYLAAVV